MSSAVRSFAELPVGETFSLVEGGGFRTGEIGEALYRKKHGMPFRNERTGKPFNAVIVHKEDGSDGEPVLINDSEGVVSKPTQDQKAFRRLGGSK